MKITDFESLIRHMPYRELAFEISKEAWFPTDEKKRFKYQNDRIKKVFENEDSIMISRHDLFNSTKELDFFVIKVLMWGYPTKGRGKNIINMFEPLNFDQTIKKLDDVWRKGNISNKDVKELFSSGLKLSTVSKFLYFLQIKVESFPALILDLRVIDSLTRKNGFEDEELVNLKTLNYNNAPKKYTEYLKAVYDLASKMKVQPDQVEMFLFEFGSNLKELKGEEGFDLDELEAPLSYNNYQVFLDLLGMGYSEEQASKSMNLTHEQLKELRQKFEPRMNKADEQ
jgi:hypothetical protein